MRSSLQCSVLLPVFPSVSQRSKVTLASAGNHTSPKPKSKPRAPSQIISSYGAELQGPGSDGYQAKAPEPRQVWNTIQDAASPFKREMIVLTGPEESGSLNIVERMVQRAQQQSGFKRVKYLPWTAYDLVTARKERAVLLDPKKRKGEGVHTTTALREASNKTLQGKTKSDDLLASRRDRLRDGQSLTQIQNPKSDSEPSAESSALIPPDLSASTVTSRTDGGEALEVVSNFESPLKLINSNYYDAVVVTASAFASFGKLGVAHAITDATRSLNKNGVLCLFGAHPRLRLVPDSPTTSDRVQGDYEDYCQYLDRVWDRDMEILQDTVDSKSAFGQSTELLQSKLKAMHDQTWRWKSSETAFENLYFPFKNTQCQWFTSRYRLSLATFVDALKSDPRYRNAVRSDAKLHPFEWECSLFEKNLVDGSEAGGANKQSAAGQGEQKTDAEVAYSEHLRNNQPVGAKIQREDPLTPLIQCLKVDEQLFKQHQEKAALPKVNLGSAAKGGSGSKADLGGKSEYFVEVEAEHWVMTMDDRPSASVGSGGVTCSLGDLHSSARLEELGVVSSSPTSTSSKPSVKFGSLLQDVAAKRKKMTSE